MSTILDSLITSRTRIKLLLRFFSNKNATAYLRSLACEFGESSNGVRLELNKLSKAGFLKSEEKGGKIMYRANEDHPLFPELNSVALKYLGLDKIVDDVVGKLGDLKLALVTGDYARGRDSGIIDLVLVGKIDQAQLSKLVRKAESLIHRKIRTLVLDKREYSRLRKTLSPEKALLLWKGDGIKV